MEEIIRQSAALRRMGNYMDAIQLIVNNLPNCEDYYLLNAYREIILAAEEGQFPEYLITYVPLLREIEPELPLLRRYSQY